MAEFNLWPHAIGGNEKESDPHADIQEWVTPSGEKRDSAGRTEANARSLFMLCADLPKFISRAEKESIEFKKIFFEQGEEAFKAYALKKSEDVENINLFFSRIYALISRILNDYIGEEYHVLDADAPLSPLVPRTELSAGSNRNPLSKTEISAETNKYLLDSFATIDSCLQDVNRDDLFPIIKFENFSVQETNQVLPFRKWLIGIESIRNQFKK